MNTITRCTGHGYNTHMHNNMHTACTSDVHCMNKFCTSPYSLRGYSSGTSSFRVRLHMRVVVLGEAWLALSAQMGTCSRASAAELSACSGSGSFTLTSAWLGENWE